jgi:DNA-binding response OmpR family regulator
MYTEVNEFIRAGPSSHRPSSRGCASSNCMPDKILVVDDDPDMLEVLRWALSPIGTVLEASNGREALRLIKSHRPRLILLDVAMPGMDGIEVLKRVRSFDSKVIVVMLTGLTDIEIAKEALDSGARAYITKPFDDRDLGAEVERLLEKGDKKAGIAAAAGCPWRVRLS